MADRPNFLIVVTDQQRRDTLGCYRGDDARVWPRTPHLDALAANGTRFSSAYCPTGVCSPTRCSLLTGLYPHAHGVIDNVSPGHLRCDLPPTAVTWSGRLGASTYATGYVGKWHVSTHAPDAFGFRDVRPGDWPHRRRAAGIPIRPGVECDPLAQLQVEDVPRSLTSPGCLTAAAHELLDQYAGGKQPWLLRVDYPEPHFPLRPTRADFERFDPAAIEPWPNFHGDLPAEPRIVTAYRRAWRMTGRTWDDLAPLVAASFAVVEQLDDEVGSLLDHLARLPGADRTVVVFTTDHGDTLGAHGLFDKGYSACDEVYRVPLLIAGPDLATGAVCDLPVVHAVDLAATVLDLAGWKPFDPSHGRSLAPLLRGEPPRDWRTAAVAEFHGMWAGGHSQRIVWRDGWKYVWNGLDRHELYDLAADPHELDNRYGDPAAGDHLTALRADLAEWQHATHDPLANRWTTAGDGLV